MSRDLLLMFAPRYDRARMWARSIVMALVLFRAATATAVTVDDLPVESVYTLARIRIEGTERVSPKTVRAVMQTRLPPWYTPWKRWLEPPLFNPNLFRGDLQRIAA